MRYFLYFFILLSIFACSSEPKAPPLDQNKIVTEALKQNLKTGKLVTGWYFVRDTATDFERYHAGMQRSMHIDPKPILTKANIAHVESYQNDNGQLGLSLRFGESGAKAWADGTLLAVDKLVACIIDDSLYMAPRVNEQITGGMSAITGNFTKEDLKALKKRLLE
ncbi:MAG: hypothetical protein AB8F95_18430 [Bacteroidia bacterium]